MEIDIRDMSDKSMINISVVGVGGGGCNTINHVINHGVHRDIKLVAVNTDLQSLQSIDAHSKLQIGDKTTGGLGAGMKPEVGRQCAEESYESIKNELEKSQIVIIATGLGGGTGTGAAPIVARAAKEVGALVIAVATTPFGWEFRDKIAEEGLKALKKEVDMIVVVPNAKLHAILKREISMKNAMQLVNDVLGQVSVGIATIVLNSGSGVNIDFADIKTVMNYKGLGLIGIGDKTGEDSAIEAVKEALESPLLDNVSISGAQGLLLHYEMSEDYPFSGINEASLFVMNQIGDNVEAKHGWTHNNNFESNRIRVTLVVTGFEKEVVSEQHVPKQDNSHPASKEIRIRRKYADGTPVDLDTPTFLRNQAD